MAAITTIAYLLTPGDRVLGPDDIYGGTYRLLVRVLQRYGIRPAFVDMTDLTRVEAALADRPRMVVIETPTNPYLKILDIARIAELAHAHDALVVVDNTFASPYLQQPLTLGADLAVHSTTKYLGGHSDVGGGGAMTNSKEIHETLKFHQNAAGAGPGPVHCRLVLRGSQTPAAPSGPHPAKPFPVGQVPRGHSRCVRVPD